MRGRMVEGRERMLVEAAPGVGVKGRFVIEAPRPVGLITQGEGGEEKDKEGDEAKEKDGGGDGSEDGVGKKEKELAKKRQEELESMDKVFQGDDYTESTPCILLKLGSFSLTLGC